MEKIPNQIQPIFEVNEIKYYDSLDGLEELISCCASKEIDVAESMKLCILPNLEHIITISRMFESNPSFTEEKDGFNIYDHRSDVEIKDIDNPFITNYGFSLSSKEFTENYIKSLGETVAKG